MVCLRRAKLTFETFRRNFTAKITKPLTPSHPFKSSPVSQRPVFNFLRNQSQSPHNYSSSFTRIKSSPTTLLFTAQRRFYCSNGGNQSTGKSFLDMRVDSALLIIVIFGVVIGIYTLNRETIPCTKRKHFVTVPILVERWIGNQAFKSMKAGEFKGKILPDTHPDSVLLRSVSKNLIEALQEGVLRHQGSASTRHLEGLNWEVLLENKLTYFPPQDRVEY